MHRSCIRTFFVEVLLRVVCPLHVTGFVGAYEYDEQLGARLKPDIHFARTTDHLQEVHTNGLGSVNYQQSFDQYETLVFALGDSYTQGTGVSSDASYPFQMDLALNMNDGRYEQRFGVVNLGLAAYGVEQAMLSLDRYVKKVGRPDYVLWLGCSNDVLDDKLFLSGYRHRHLVDGSPHWGALVKPLQYMTNDTEIGKRLKQAVSRVRRRRHTQTAERTEEAKHCLLPLSALGRLAKRCQALNAKLLVSWTDPGSDGDESYRVLQDWADSRPQVQFVDWYSSAETVMTALPDLPFRNSHSGGHYRTWVNRLIAARFARAVNLHSESSRSASVPTN